MGVMQRFERRLESLVEGTFAKVFKGVVQPVEIAQSLQRETDDRKAVVGEGRVLVPNEFVVELGPRDYDRLSPYAEPLGDELAAMVGEHAEDHTYTFVGPVTVGFELHDELQTGLFRIRSGVAATPGHEAAPPPAAQPPAPPQATQVVRTSGAGGLAGNPRLAVAVDGSTSGGTPESAGHQRAFPVTKPLTVIGRGHDVDIRLEDPRVSRRHAEIRLDGAVLILADLESTNGTRVNDVPVSRRQLASGDRVAIGGTTLIFQRDPDH